MAKKPTNSATRQVTAYEFAVKVFQGGQEVASFTRPLGRWTVGLTNSIGGEFTVPLFTIPNNSLKFRSSVQGITLTIEGPWTGLIRSGSRYFNQPYRLHEPTIIDLSPGDIGTFQFYGLTFAMKLQKARKTAASRKHRLNPKLRSGPFSDFIRSFTGPWVTAWSVLLALLLLGGIVSGLLSRQHYRPRNFSELTAAYTLPFVAPRALATIPEALNVNLKYDDVIGQTIRHYEAVTEMLMDLPIAYPQSLYPSSIERARHSAAERNAVLAAAWDSGLESDRNSAENPNDSRVHMQAASSGVDQEVMGLMHRISEYQAGLDLQLQSRRSISREFPLGEPYDYSEYFSPKKAGLMAKSNAAATAQNLEKIRIDGTATEEEKIYLAAEALGERAKRVQGRVSGLAAGRGKVRSEPQIVLLTAALTQISAVPGSLRLISEERLAALQGVVFGEKPRVTAPVRELATGTIDPRAVERTIEAGQFRLRLCFESALRRNQGAKGVMNWRWRIDTSGKPQNMQLVSSSIRDDTMVRCVRDVMMTWTFPRPNKGSVLVHRSFEFQAEAG